MDHQTETVAPQRTNHTCPLGQKLTARLYPDECPRCAEITAARVARQALAAKPKGKSRK
jgi:hypothetical protein